MTTGANPTPGLNGAIRELIAVAASTRMVAEGRTAPLSERITRSKAGSTHLAYVGGELPLSEKLERSVRRLTDVYRREVEGKYPRQLPAQDKVSAARKAQTKAILGEVGMDPTAVAYVHGSTTERVEKLRGKYGRDPKTGQRLTELRAGRIDGAPTHAAPLTAPPRAAQERLEERAADGELGS